MICVVDARVAIRWFVAGEWARREDGLEPALALLRASASGLLDWLQPPHVLAEVAAVLARLSPASPRRDIAKLAGPDGTWGHATASWSRAIETASALRHHPFHPPCRALALDTPGAVLITARRRCVDKVQRHGHIAWLPDFRPA